jgi:hypothetical protein
VRIQAVELIAEPTEVNLKGAVELLTLILDAYPDKTQIASAHQALGHYHELSGHSGDALVSYRCALEQQRAFPHART